MRITVDDLTNYIDPDAFPASKDECILMAGETDAPFEIMDALVSLPEGTYGNIEELTAALNANLV